MSVHCSGSPGHDEHRSLVEFVNCSPQTVKETTGARTRHVVLVHGASHGAWCWYKVVTLLLRKGYKVAAIDLTAMGRNRAVADSVSSIEEFAKPLLDYLESVTEQVLLVGHSLGGITISYAMEQYPEKIAKAVFVVARMLLNNQSFLSSLPPNTPARLPPGSKKLAYANGRSAPPTSVEFNLKQAVDFLYSESPEEDIQLALSLLSPQPYVVYRETVTLTPERYGRVPRFYIKTSRDRLAPPSDQQVSIDRNPPTMVFTVDSDHSPFFSTPSELTTLLEEICKMTIER
ncbi:hypothetical protein MPTK1_3g09410 [Marchantia polymorpha subsp. ruderalis]|uniref:AB hydrolase-1 domain-containing protein n=2 Tax=Marchantia polymorpha TaxID=3197 RepID=A0AAF6AZ11_MARPO|nr:hypothetical protein MARPO_0085s0086 [Marchantia polymorpha]BBN04995.1 hypothetical protein Mp_3g09410 [Marchantia polymorpha subsp. ruderalis]|eukprot:PTQ33878.1 hypothetical protein MARPO_0085s0086 [Marchantia polymorpha]